MERLRIVIGPECNFCAAVIVESVEGANSDVVADDLVGSAKMSVDASRMD